MTLNNERVRVDHSQRSLHLHKFGVFYLETNFNDACSHSATHENVLRCGHIVRRANTRQIVEETARNAFANVRYVLVSLIRRVDELKAVPFAEGASHAAVFPQRHDGVMDVGRYALRVSVHALCILYYLARLVLQECFALETERFSSSYVQVNQVEWQFESQHGITKRRRSLDYAVPNVGAVLKEFRFGETLRVNDSAKALDENSSNHK